MGLFDQLEVWGSIWLVLERQALPRQLESITIKAVPITKARALALLFAGSSTS
jgi:hypothetical protein